jgi:hypothetical protein
MASPTLRDDFPETVELYSTFIKQMKAENPQLNVSDLTYAIKSGGGKWFGKRGSSGVSNNSNADIADLFFDKHEYHTLTPEQKHNLRLKRLKRGNVGTGQNSRDGKSHAKGSQSSTIKQMQRTISARSSSIDKLGVPSDDEDDCESEEETESTNRSNSALTCQTKKKGKKGKWYLCLSTFTMSLRYVGQVKGVNRSDPDSQAAACVVGKDALIFNDFDREVTVSGYDHIGETKSLGTVSAALGYVIPEIGKNVLLIIHQAISLPTLDHNLLSTMQWDCMTWLCTRPQSSKVQNPPPSHAPSVSVSEAMRWMMFWWFPWTYLVLCHVFQHSNQARTSLKPIPGMNILMKVLCMIQLSHSSANKKC